MAMLAVTLMSGFSAMATGTAGASVYPPRDDFYQAGGLWTGTTTAHNFTNITYLGEDLCVPEYITTEGTIDMVREGVRGPTAGEPVKVGTLPLSWTQYILGPGPSASSVDIGPLLHADHTAVLNQGGSTFLFADDMTGKAVFKGLLGGIRSPENMRASHMFLIGSPAAGPPPGPSCQGDVVTPNAEGALTAILYF